MSTTQEPEIVGTALVSVDRGTPLPVFSGQEMAAAFTAYRELQQTLDRAMPDQIMKIGDKAFRKKGYWRAIRTAFNLTVECIKEERTEVMEQGGLLDAGWLVTYRATAPNGRYAEGDGACYASEKNRGHMTATEHNVRSHAHTRAFNRAVSNLCGFGEVSAEEVEHHAPNAAPAQSQPQRAAQQRQAARPSGGVTLISEAQAKRFYAIAKNNGWEDADLRDWLKEVHGLESDRDIPRAKYDAIVADVEKGPTYNLQAPEPMQELTDDDIPF